MAYYIKIDTKQQFEFIKRIVENSHVKMHSNVGAYVEYIDIVDALKEAFDNPVDFRAVGQSIQKEEEKILEAATKSKTVNKTRKKLPAVAKLPSLCEDHPTFRAMRAPRTDCKTCWAAYKRLNPTKWANAHRKFLRTQRQANE